MTRCWLFPLLFVAAHSAAAGEFRAGTALTDVTPKKLPVIVNGSMTSRSVDTIKTPLSARSFAFSDGKETLVIVVVDSCMMPRPLLDEVKAIAAEKAGIGTDRILISATHTHTAGSCMGALGTDADPVYSLYLKKKLVEAILAPLQKLQPARIGWAEIDAGEFTALRRWALHPDHVREDPFGNPTVFANMHAASDWEKVTGKTGPEDPMLRLISIQTAEGKPLGVLANYSMHYFGDRDISADYFGLFCDGLKARIAPEDEAFLAAMSHGCSGDIWRHDYEKSADRKDPDQQWTIEEYAEKIVDRAVTALEGIEHTSPASIAMTEKRMTLPYRTPNKQLLEWSQRIVAEMGGRPPGGRLPKTQPEIYAREQVLLHEKGETEIVVQALRLGDDVAIATTPNETYALTGLKIINASPAEHTMVIELANGGDGYIPPPEQHLLGGYNTWAARSAGLEVEAEPKITEAAVALLEQIAGPRTDRRPGHGPAASHVLSLKPRAYYRLDEFAGPRAVDASPNGLDAFYEPKVLFYLQGPSHDRFSIDGLNRAAHFAGDRLAVRIPGMTKQDYAVSLWFWSGTPDASLDEPEWIVSRGVDYSEGTDRVGVAMSEGKRMIVCDFPGNLRLSEPMTAEVERWKWHHLAVAREKGGFHVFLDGRHIIAHQETSGPKTANDTLFFGGGSDRTGAFHGRLDEIAVWDEIVSSEQIESIYREGSEKPD